MATIDTGLHHGNEWSLHVDFSSIPLTAEQFYRLSCDNPELRMELTAEGELIVMSPTGSKTGHRNANLNYQLFAWAKRDGTGVTFDSSTVFSLPNRAKRSPDASWVRRDRWDALSAEDQERFAPVCPDFVVELRSPSDGLTTLQAKMEEYRDNGARLGWLIDPIEKRVYVYRPGSEVARLDQPETLDGADVLPGFVLELSEMF